MTQLNFNPTSSFPISFGDGGSGGDIVIDNPGTSGYINMSIYGHVVNPRIITENEDGTSTLAWDWTIGVGEYLDIDPQTPTSLLQGQVSRPPIIRQWPRLTAGINTFRFRADAYSASALLVVTALPAD